MRLYIILRCSDSSHLGSLLMLVVDLWPLAVAVVHLLLCYEALAGHWSETPLRVQTGSDWTAPALGGSAKRDNGRNLWRRASCTFKRFLLFFFARQFFPPRFDNKGTIKQLTSSNEPLLSHSGRTWVCTAAKWQNKRARTQRGRRKQNKNWMEKWTDTWRICWSASKPLRPTETLICE